ncbi:MAG TPA: type II CRISPR-associated endonuclease Cas1 [Crocinitomicaceae bacterium]|nr:type II CRISPR-associated endonuclease Cas1 [Crocinitomicaceae bacterium]
MVKRTLHFGNPAHLSVSNSQLIVELKDEQRTKHSVPIMDLGMVVLENPQITLTTAVLEAFMSENIALVSCNKNYMPSGMFLPFDANTTQTKIMKTQVEASAPLKKQLWQQTVKAKIQNQASLLDKLNLNSRRLHVLKEQVLSGDTTNCEGQAAGHYWNQLYGTDFIRSQERNTPNSQLNYGYAILRSIVARALSASGLHPSLGLFHKNQYNAFCLADDIMEPYRPFVDWAVFQMIQTEKTEELTKEQKIELLKLPQLDVTIGRITRPLFHAVSTTTAGLNRCLAQEIRKIPYPDF